MIFRVEVTESAEREAYAIHARIAADSPLNGLRWVEQFCTAIRSMDSLPRRCTFAPESDDSHEEARVWRLRRLLLRPCRGGNLAQRNPRVARCSASRNPWLQSPAPSGAETRGRRK